MGLFSRRRSDKSADAVDPQPLPVDPARVTGPMDVGPIRTSFREFGRNRDQPAEPVPPSTREELPSSEKALTLALENNIQQLLAIDGAMGAAVIDQASGMALAQGGTPGFDLSVAAAGNSNVVRAKLATMADIGLTGKIDDILITLESQYHLINVLDGPATQGLFIYLVLDRTRANLALARHKLAQMAKDITV